MTYVDRDAFHRHKKAIGALIGEATKKYMKEVGIGTLDIQAFLRQTSVDVDTLTMQGRAQRVTPWRRSRPKRQQWDGVPLRFTPIRTPHETGVSCSYHPSGSHRRRHSQQCHALRYRSVGAARLNHRDHGSECGSPRAKSGQVAVTPQRGLDPGTGRTQDHFSLAPVAGYVALVHRNAYPDYARLVIRTLTTRHIIPSELSPVSPRETGNPSFRRVC